ncbi:glycine cleavage system H protein [Gammaproteobacteria bacterium]
MSNSQEYRYTQTHEWARLEHNGEVTIGITEHAQDLLGDIIFIELPEPEEIFSIGETCGVVESVKAASDLYAPLTGEVVAVNETLNTAPEKINEDPLGAGWIFRIQLINPTEWDELLNASAYATLIAED